MAALAFVWAVLYVVVYFMGVIGGAVAMKGDDPRPIFLMLLLSGLLLGFVSVMVLLPSFKQLYGG